jgi:hypothetical protein
MICVAHDKRGREIQGPRCGLDSHTLFWEHVETVNLGKSGANMRAVGDASSTRRLVGYLMPARMP